MYISLIGFSFIKPDQLEDDNNISKYTKEEILDCIKDSFNTFNLELLTTKKSGELKNTIATPSDSNSWAATVLNIDSVNQLTKHNE